MAERKIEEWIEEYVDQIARDFSLLTISAWRHHAKVKLADAYANRPVSAPFGPGDYSCAECGMGMVEPCEHWKRMLANSAGVSAETEETVRAAGEHDLLRLSQEFIRVVEDNWELPEEQVFEGVLNDWFLAWLKSFKREIGRNSASASSAPESEGWKDVFDSPPMHTWVVGVVEHDGKRQTVPVFAIPKGAGFAWQSEFPVVMWRALPVPPATEGQ